MGAILWTFMLVLFAGSGVVAAIAALARMTTSGSDVYQHSGSFRHEHTGTIRHEVAGSVQHTVQHVGTVQHVHQIDPADRARLDALVAQRELEEAEQARVELRRRAAQPQVVELRRIPPAIGR